MRKTLLLLMALCGSLCAQEFASPKPSLLSPEAPGKRLWTVSLASLAVANALDIHSSWGKRELNPTLAGHDGTFGSRGALIKMGIQGGIAGMQYLLTRGRPSGRFYKAMSIINFGASAGFAITAARNYSVPRAYR
jgi:hypothetical protein